MSTVDGQSAPGGSLSSEPADLKLEALVIPVADADRSNRVLRRPRLEARRRLLLRQWLPGRAVHATRIAVLRAVRHQDHRCPIRFCPWPLPDRLRH